MRLIKYVFIAMITAVLFAIPDTTADAFTQSSKYKAPDFTLRDMSGKKVKLSSFEGKPVLLNFWATWCGYCRKERPHLNKVYNLYKDKGLVVISVSTDQSVDKVKRYLEKIPADFLVLMDDNRSAASAYGIRGYPSSFLLDRKGYVKHRIVGFREWTSASSRKILDRLISEE